MLETLLYRIDMQLQEKESPHQCEIDKGGTVKQRVNLAKVRDDAGLTIHDERIQ